MSGFVCGCGHKAAAPSVSPTPFFRSSRSVSHPFRPCPTIGGVNSFTPVFSPLHLQLIDSCVPYAADSALSAATTLRKAGVDSGDASAILTQAKLRTQARAKFGERALSMLFTEAGYEQSTRLAVARLHAQRFTDAKVHSVADLGCGIGADSMAFADAGLKVVSVEFDAKTASFTEHNMSVYEQSKVLCADIMNLNIDELTDGTGSPIQSLWLDPARREVEGSASKRVWDAESFSPPFSFVKKLAATGIPMGVKMGPGMPHEEIPDNCEAQWISHGGSVVEVVLWFNALARTGVRRSATAMSSNVLEPEVLAEITSDVWGTDSPELEAHELSNFIYEPDGAVIRAHLVAELAQEYGLNLIDENIAYLTGDHHVAAPLMHGYEVLEKLPLHEKHLKKWVKAQGITALTIKKRGVDIVPESLRAKLLAGTKKKKGQPPVSATLIATRLGSGSLSERFALHVKPAS